MLRSMFRMLFSLTMALSLALGLFSGIGVSLASAASSQPVAASGYNPVASQLVPANYCYPSGYNKQGWRCGWRLAMYPYPMSTYNCGYQSYYSNCGNYGYNNGYYGGYYPYNSGYGGRGNTNYIADYGGRPRYDPCYYGGYSGCGGCYNNCYNYNYNPCYNQGYNYNYGNYCPSYRRK